MYEASARSPHGGIILSGPEGTYQRDTVQCCHCGMHWIVEPGSGRQRGFCMKCMQVTCGAENCQACIPTEQKLDIHEKEGIWLF